jgi:hypothetical protein
VNCPRCDQKLSLQKEPPRGAKLRCPNCRGTITFPLNNPNAKAETYDLSPGEFSIYNPPVRELRPAPAPVLPRSRSSSPPPIPPAPIDLGVDLSRRNQPQPRAAASPTVPKGVFIGLAALLPIAAVAAFLLFWPGKARVHVTWEYNKFVGNRADTGSLVILIPPSFHGSIPFFVANAMSAHMAEDIGREKLQPQGVYVSVVGGNGDAVFNSVPAGNYKLLIISGNTRPSSAESELSKQELAQYLEDTGAIVLSKTHFTDLTVVEGGEVEYSHDFGNTYF